MPQRNSATVYVDLVIVNPNICALAKPTTEKASLNSKKSTSAVVIPLFQGFRQSFRRSGREPFGLLLGIGIRFNVCQRFQPKDCAFSSLINTKAAAPSLIGRSVRGSYRSVFGKGSIQRRDFIQFYIGVFFIFGHHYRFTASLGYGNGNNFIVKLARFQALAERS
jgi:hypothetical protein